MIGYFEINAFKICESPWNGSKPWGVEWAPYQCLSSPDPYFPRCNEEILFKGEPVRFGYTTAPPKYTENYYFFH